MTRTTRPVTAGDFDQTLALGLEAFGDLPAGTPRPTAEGFPFPGRHSWGVFDDGRLVARTIGREYASWWHGAAVPTCGVAGVTVVAEHRGEGLLAELFRVVLDEAAERGEVLSTLYPTAPGIYRRLGYEVVTALDEVDLVTAELAGVRPAAGTTLRRAGVEDVPAVRQVYDAWAAAQNGPLTRRGVSFGDPDEDLLGEHTGTTLAVDGDGRVVGYASWRRGTGYDETGRLEVTDLLGLTGEATRALWRLAAGFASVTPTVRLQTSGADAARLVLPGYTWRRVSHRPYMLRVSDPAGALSGLPLHVAGGGSAEVAFRVAGDPLGTMDGDYRLVVAGGSSRCERAAAPADAPTYTPQGLALAYAGVQDCANLRLAGHLAGSTASDADLDALLRGRPAHVRDYF